MLILRGLIAIAICGLLLSDGFAQSPIPKDKTKGTTQNTTTDKRGTDEVPFAIKILPAPDAATKAADEKQERDKKAATDDLLVQWTHALFWATVALASIAAVQVGFFWWQLLLMRDGVKDAAIAARAAKKSADAAERNVEILRRQTQAEVGVSAAKLEFPSDIPTATVVIKNFGQTSARSLTLIGGLALREYPLQATIWSEELPNVASEAILGANEPLRHVTQSPGPLTELQQTEVANGTMTFYVYGRITYKDVFNAVDTHTTEYLYFHQKLPGVPQGSLAAYPTGNTAK